MVGALGVWPVHTDGPTRLSLLPRLRVASIHTVSDLFFGLEERVRLESRKGEVVSEVRLHCLRPQSPSSSFSSGCLGLVLQCGPSLRATGKDGAEDFSGTLPFISDKTDTDPSVTSVLDLGPDRKDSAPWGM